MSFAEIDLGHDPILYKTKKAVIKFAWMSFPEIGLVLTQFWLKLVIRSKNAYFDRIQRLVILEMFEVVTLWRCWARYFDLEALEFLKWLIDWKG